MTITTADGLEGLLEPDDVCLDIGAGAGRHTRWMAQRVGLFGQVHAFEPRPVRRRLLRARTWALIQVTVTDPAAVRDLGACCERRVAVIRIAAGVRTVPVGAALLLRRDRPVVLLDGPPHAGSSDVLRRAGYRIDACARFTLCTPPSVVRHLPVASILTTALSGLLAVGIGAAVWRSQGRRIDPWWLLASVPVVLLLDPVRLTLLLGQVNLVLLAMVLVDVRGTRWRGVLIGLAAAVKLTPLVFVVWPVIQGDRRAAVRAVATFAGATVAGLLIAPAQSVRFWTDWVFRLDGMLAPENAGNQNLRAVIVRLGLPPYDTRMLWLLLAAAVLVAGAAVAVRARRAGEPLLGAMVLSVCALLASPISWSHHWVWVLPVLPLLVDLALRRHLAWPMWTAGTGLALFAIGPHWFLPREQHRELAWTAGEQVVGASSVLWGVALLVLVTQLRSSAPVTGQVRGDLLGGSGAPSPDATTGTLVGIGAATAGPVWSPRRRPPRAATP